MAIFVLAVLPWSVEAAQPRQRIRGSIDDSSRFALLGNVRPALERAQDLGMIPGGLRLSAMSIDFVLTASQNADLLQLERLQQSRHSLQFHKWLTPEQFGERFGLNERDLQKMTAWLANQGFVGVEVSRSRNAISFEGTAAQAQAAFNTNIHRYQLNGVPHYANATAPEFPKALQGVVASLHGLHDFRASAHVRPRYTSAIDANYHLLAPGDFATIYDLKALYGAGIDGTGIKIAVAGQTDVDLTDVAAFRAAAGLTASVPQVILTGTDPGTSKGDLPEAMLDIEWAGGVAPGAQVIYVNSDSAFTSLRYAIQNNLADVATISYGDCEATWGNTEVGSWNLLFKQATAQGMTVLAPSGDDGAADCEGHGNDKGVYPTVASHGLGVDYPASSPNVTGVGGTAFNQGSGSYWSTTNDLGGGSALSYIPETAWNDSVAYASLAASGGGASIFAARPVWQTGLGVPADDHRHVPDIALVTSPSYNEGGYLICVSGSCANGFTGAETAYSVYGGTSVSAPAFAGIVALLVQKTGLRQGNINQNLYTLATLSKDAFHDIDAGDNLVPCTGGTPDCSSTVAATPGTLGYAAGVGYDPVTGLGSVDGYHLVSEWPADLTSSINPTSLSLVRGAAGSATVSVTEMYFTAGVTFTCSVAATLTNTTCAVAGAVTGSGTTTLTITAGAKAAADPWWHQMPRLPGGGMQLEWICFSLLLATGAYAATKHRKTQFLGMGFAFVLLAGLSGCGSGNASSTGTATSVTSAVVIPPETGLVTVVATSGALTSTATVAVTIQ